MVAADVMWRAGQPDTARAVRGWWHALYLEMRLGFPFYRTMRLRATADYGYQHLRPADAAREIFGR